MSSQIYCSALALFAQTVAVYMSSDSYVVLLAYDLSRLSTPLLLKR